MFDPVRRDMARARGADRHDIIGALVGESLIDRLSMITRPLGRALLLGARNVELIDAVRARCDWLTVVETSPTLAGRRGAQTVADDRLLTMLGARSHDCIVWPGGMESVDDVPGTLIQLGRILAPDGLLIGAVVGDGSWTGLRAALARADGNRGIPRFHPQIDVRSVGDLMARAGLTMPVIDVEPIALSYTSLRPAVRDLRHAGLGRCLSAPTRRIDRATLSRAEQAFAADRSPEDADRTIETVRVIHFIAWSRGPDQPRPAQRGSARQSLADALRSPRSAPAGDAEAPG